jgi:SH3 domain protein
MSKLRASWTLLDLWRRGKTDEAVLYYLKEEKEKLQKERAQAINAERIRWFLAGAGVLFLGWLIGLLMGRKQKKRDYIISYWR